MESSSIGPLGFSNNSIDYKSLRSGKKPLPELQTNKKKPVPHFNSRIQSRLKVESIEEFVQAQCRICGIHDLKCLKIFGNGAEIRRIIKTFLPIKVSCIDAFPKTACLECLGILQTMDDLAYRACLVEVSFQNIQKVPTDVVCVTGRNAALQKKENNVEDVSQEQGGETVSEGSSNAPKVDESPDTSQDMDYNMLIPEVSLHTPSEPLTFLGGEGNTIFVNNSTVNCLSRSERRRAQHRKRASERRRVQRRIRAFENSGINRNLHLHSYAKPYSEAAFSAEMEECYEVTPNSDSMDDDVTVISYVKPASAESSEEIPRGESVPIQASTVQSINLHSYAKPSKDTQKNPTANVSPTAAECSVEISCGETVLIQGSTVPSIGLHSYAKSSKATQQKPTTKEALRPLSDMFEISSAKLADLMAGKSVSFLSPQEGNSRKDCSKKKKKVLFRISRANTLPTSDSSHVIPVAKKSFLAGVVPKKNGPFSIHGCYICDKKFGQYSHLLSHMQISHSATDKSCPVCEKVFDQPSIQPLLGHRKIHSETELKKWSVGSEVSTNFKCETCSNFFFSRIHKIFHDIYHHQLPLWSCEFCLAECFSSEALEKHLKMCKSSSQTFKRACHVCSEIYENLTDFQQHVQSHAESYTCDYCFSSFTSSRLLEEHVQVDHSDKPYACELCGKAFVIETVLIQHGQSFHPSPADPKNNTPSANLDSAEICEDKSIKEQKKKGKIKSGKKFKCGICSLVFSEQFERNIHRYMRHKELACVYCGAFCNDAEKLLVHTRNCKENREVDESEGSKISKKGPQKRKRNRDYIYECDTCHRKFLSGTSLRNHKSIHTGERPHMCPVCGKTFRTKELWFTHSKRHTDVKHYSCQYCSLSFTAMDKLYTHKRSKHRDQFKYHCKACNRFFNSSKHFVIHTQMCIFFGSPPEESNGRAPLMKCLVCPKFFKSDVTMNQHERRKHDETYPPVCRVCTEKFLSVALLRKHLEKHFNNNEIKNIDCPKCYKTFINEPQFRDHKCNEPDSEIGISIPSSTDPSGEGTIPNQTDDKINDISTNIAKSMAPSCEADSESIQTASCVHVKEDNSGEFVTELIKRFLDAPDNTRENKTEGENNTLECKDGTNDETYRMTDKTTETESLATPQEPLFNGLENFKASDNKAGELVENKIKPVGDSMPLETLSGVSDKNMIFQCTFCNSDFYDNGVFVFHLKHEHNLNLDSLEFQLTN